MIIVTGAAGFISGYLVQRLNELNYKDLVLVDDFSNENKKLNYSSAQFKLLVDRKDFIEWLHQNHRMVQMVIHLGARTDTTEFNVAIFVANFCILLFVFSNQTNSFIQNQFCKL